MMISSAQGHHDGRACREDHRWTATDRKGEINMGDGLISPLAEEV